MGMTGRKTERGLKFATEPKHRSAARLLTGLLLSASPLALASQPAAAQSSTVVRFQGSDEVACRVPADHALTNPDGVALIVGNRGYTDLPDVEFALNDARAACRLAIEGLGFDPANVRVYKDLTGNQLSRVLGDAQGGGSALQQFLPTPEVAARRDVFVYFSGHGMPSYATDDPQAHLMPIDGDARVEATGYPLDRLYRRLDELGPRNALVVLDACFSGTTGAGEPVIAGVSSVPFLPTPPKVPEGVAAFAAGAHDQVANWDMERGQGLFTATLLDGLQGGAADRASTGNGDGAVTLAELQDYAVASLPPRAPEARAQVPQLEPGPGVDLAAWTFRPLDQRSTAPLPSDGPPGFARTYSVPAADVAPAVAATAQGFALAATRWDLERGGEGATLLLAGPDGRLLAEAPVEARGKRVARAVAAHPEGGAVLAGEFWGDGAGGPQAIVVRFDAQGREAWRKILSGLGQGGAHAVAVAPDGTIAVAGGGDGGAWMVGLGPDGSATLETRWPGGDEVARAVLPTPDGYALAGTGGGGGWLRRVGADGAVFWQAWVPEGGVHGLAADATGFVVAGETAGSGKPDFQTGFGEVGGEALLAKFDGAGNRLWLRAYGEGDGLRAVAADPQGQGFVAAGFADASFNGSRAWLLKVDANGDPLWQRDLKDGRATSLAALGDGYAVAGLSGGEGRGRGVVWLEKRSPDGALSEGPALASTAPPPPSALAPLAAPVAPVAPAVQPQAVAPQPQQPPPAAQAAVQPTPAAALEEPPGESGTEASEAVLSLSAEQRRMVQAALSGMGHSVGAIDGQFGPRTRQALAVWQARRGDDPSGYLTGNQFLALISEGR